MFKISSDILSVSLIIILGIVSKNERIKMSLVRLIERLFTKNAKSTFIDADFPHDDKIFYQSFCKLMKYQYKAMQLNNMYRRRAMSELTKKEKFLLGKVGYFAKFDTIEDEHIAVNQKAITQLLLSETQNNDFFELKDVATDSQYLTPLSNITESLNHLVRDYNEYYFANEVKPLVDYILKEIDGISTSNEIDIIVPGSGAGRIAYEISKNVKNSKIFSIELNSLMYALNSSLYKCEEKLNIKPFILDYSNHLDLSDQTKSFEIITNKFEKPQNLELICDNFLKFIPCNTDNNKIGIVVTAFFMDTAENILEYMEKIESMKKYYKRVHWINIGPLKYGTRPKVVLTSNEWNIIRKERGWNDQSLNCDVDKEIGYLTNYSGLYKGRYSLLKFHSIYE